MRITHELLMECRACSDKVEMFRTTYPDGLEPTVENAAVAAASGFDVIWCVRLLPLVGPGSQVAFALWCAEQVVHLATDPRVSECLSVVSAEVESPGSQDLTVAADASWAAAEAEWAADATAAATAAAWAAWAARAVTAAWVARAAKAAAEAAAKATWAEAEADTWAAVEAARAARAARAVTREAQIAMLGQMLSDVPERNTPATKP